MRKETMLGKIFGIALVFVMTGLMLPLGAFGSQSQAFATNEVVTFPDPNLEAAIREAISKPEGPIYTTDLEGLIELYAQQRGITDLSGLEHCTSLTHLQLGDNQISDISPIQNLTSLTYLYLSGNQISDIEPLVNNPGLSEGDTIDLRDNPLSVTSIDVYIPQLEARGVEVLYDAVYTPSNPSPANGAANVSAQTDLGWTGGDPDAGDTVTYDVYFDTTGATTLVSNDQSTTTYASGTLSYNTKYYWKIVARDNHGIVREGPVWDFTTALSGKTVLWNCPLGGQALIAPYPAAGRPFLSVAAPCSGIAVSAGAQLWGIYYLDEISGTWLYYIPGFATSTLTQLQPGKYYYVVVSKACTLTIPQ